MKTLLNTCLGGTFVLISSIAQAGWFTPDTLEDCLFKASRMPTSKGVDMAAMACYQRHDDKTPTKPNVITCKDKSGKTMSVNKDEAGHIHIEATTAYKLGTKIIRWNSVVYGERMFVMSDVAFESIKVNYSSADGVWHCPRRHDVSPMVDGAVGEFLCPKMNGNVGSVALDSAVTRYMSHYNFYKHMGQCQ